MPIATNTWARMDCATPPHLAVAGEVAIANSNVTAYFDSAGQRQVIMSYTANGGTPQYWGNGMATVTAVGNTSVAAVVNLVAGQTYVFFPSIHADFSPVTVQYVQCTTVLEIVK